MACVRVCLALALLAGAAALKTAEVAEAASSAEMVTEALSSAEMEAAQEQLLRETYDIIKEQQQLMLKEGNVGGFDTSNLVSAGANAHAGTFTASKTRAEVSAMSAEQQREYNIAMAERAGYSREKYLALHQRWINNLQKWAAIGLVAGGAEIGNEVHKMSVMGKNFAQEQKLGAEYRKAVAEGEIQPTEVPPPAIPTTWTVLNRLRKKVFKKKPTAEGVETREQKKMKRLAKKHEMDSV